MNTEQLIRLECLKLAATSTSGPSDTCKIAQVYTNFVRGPDKAGATPVPDPAHNGETQDKPRLRHDRR